MISTQYECIFIHQRKCAGTAVIMAFGLLPSDPHFHYMNDRVLNAEYTQRPAHYFVFSVVRNPWDRFHGHYRSYFDEECRALFAQRFARDIEMFGYRY